jgi:hypothetical protein
MILYWGLNKSGNLGEGKNTLFLPGIRGPWIFLNGSFPNSSLETA